MSLRFKAWQTPWADKLGIKRWFPRLVKKKKPRNIIDIGKKVSKRCSVTMGDTMNVLYSALEIIVEEMLEGYSVQLDGIGTFTVMAKSTGNGVETAEEVNASQINGLRIRFLPEGTRTPMYGVVREMLANVTFERIEEEKKKSK